MAYRLIGKKIKIGVCVDHAIEDHVDRYVHIQEDRNGAELNRKDKKNGSFHFYLRPGLAGNFYVSFQSSIHKDSYLVEHDGVVAIYPIRGDEAFYNKASWKLTQPLDAESFMIENVHAANCVMQQTRGDNEKSIKVMHPDNGNNMYWNIYETKH